MFILTNGFICIAGDKTTFAQKSYHMSFTADRAKMTMGAL